MAGGEDDRSLLQTHPWTPPTIPSVDGFTSALPPSGGLATSSCSCAPHCDQKVIQSAKRRVDNAAYPLLEQSVEGSRTLLRRESPLRHGQHGIPPPPDPLTSQDPQPTYRATKRQRLNETRMPFPRKRAVAACQLCRSRKVGIDYVDNVMKFAHVSRQNVTTSVLHAVRVILSRRDAYIRIQARITRRQCAQPPQLDQFPNPT